MIAWPSTTPVARWAALALGLTVVFSGAGADPGIVAARAVGRLP